MEFCGIKNSFPKISSVFHLYLLLLTKFLFFSNNFHTRLKFARENEVDNVPNFLDISNQRDDNILNFDHHCRPTYTDNFFFLFIFYKH